mmetsp:Transcript_58672/g.102709  ORF Transcript_58672/g.102709 Transcript_58672/m.102709 type:complete len:202 (-) Transcript_58672:80-685(-)
MAEGEKKVKINGKVIVAGPAAAGKTCLIERFVNDVYSGEEGPTLGVDCQRKSVFIDNTEVHLFLYDTAGQERFANMQQSYYRLGEVCLLCFDLSELSSFDNTVWWHKKVQEAKNDIGFVLVGCKEDKIADSQVNISKIVEWAEEKGMPYFPTSSLKGGGPVKFLFHTVGEKIMRMNLEKRLNEKNGLKLGEDDGSKKKGCC